MNSRPGNALRPLLAVFALLICGPAHDLAGAYQNSYNHEAAGEMITGYGFLLSDNALDAASHIKQAVKLDRKSLFLKTLYAEVLYKLRRYGEVDKILAPVADSQDSVALEAIKLLAFSNQAAGRTEKSIKYYKRAVKQAPEDQWLRRRLLELLRTQERYREIIPLYKPLLHETSDTYAFDLFQMGAIYLRIGGREPAREYLEKSVAADSSLAEAYHLLGNIDEMEGRWEAALENYLTFIELRPDDAGKVFGRILAVAQKTVQPTARTSPGDQAREREAEVDSSAWHGFIKTLEGRKARGDSLNPALQRVMALGYEAVGQGKKAVEIYQAIAQADPGERFSRRSLLRLLYAAGRYREMIPIYHEILDPDDDSYATDLLQLGALYMKVEDLEKAGNYIQEAIYADTSLAGAYQLMGHLFEIQGQWLEAMDNYTRFLELNPSEFREFFDRVVAVSVRAEKLDKPIGMIQGHIAAGDTSAWAAEQLGRLYYQNGDFESAFEIMEPLKRNGALSNNGFYILGFLYARSDSLPQAVEAFIRVKNSRPDYIPVYLTLGRLYTTMKKLGNAAAVLEGGLERAQAEKSEHRKELIFSLANVCHERGDYEEMETYLRQVLRENPDFAPALNYLGYFYADRGTKLEEAERLISKALEQDPENGHYLDSLGWVLFKMGRFEAALELIRDSLAALGDHAEVYEHLGDIYFAQGRHKLAKEAWNKSLELNKDNEKLKKKLERQSTGKE
ncbi:MAG: tetratricopeptide repeat protein [Gemmatimonadota bacterium]|nr:tetratricopeptide repeat protein [Gemmatimonadota bacterium]